MANEILKTIKINVNSSEYKALEKSLREIAKLEKEINKLNKLDNDTLQLRLKALDEKIKKTEKSTRLEENEKRVQIQKYNNEKQSLILNSKLLKLKERQIKIEQDARFKERRDMLQSKAYQRQNEQRREILERGEMPFIAKFQRYKGIQGLANLRTDIVKRRGEEQVRSIDDEIFARQQQLESKKIDYDELYEKRYGKGSEKLTPYQKGKLTQQLKQNKKEQASIAGMIEGVGGLKDKRAATIGATKTKLAGINPAAAAVMTVLQPVMNGLKKLNSAIMDSVKAMLDFKTGVATFGTSTSLITNAQARETQMKYGLTAGQSYAFSKASELLNIQSDEDLMYMNSEQRERFMGYMEKYAAWYDKMEASGVLNDIQEMQLEFEEFKQEIAMEFLQWVAENKEELMAILRFLFDAAKAIVEIIMKILNVISLGRYKAKSLSSASDVTNNSSTTNNSRVTNVTVNANTTNNATGVLGSQESLNKFNEENFNALAKQLVTAVGG